MSNTIALPEALNAANAVALLDDLQRRISAQAQAVCVLDVSAVRSFDSAGLALLLSARRCAQSLGKTLTVQGWTDGLLALAQVYGVAQLLDPTVPATAQISSAADL